MSKKNNPLVLMIAVSLMVFVYMLLVIFQPKDEINMPLAWNGIIPGKTTIQQAIESLGKPNVSEIRSGFLVYRYEYQYKGNGSISVEQPVELWAYSRNSEHVIGAIAISNTYGQIERWSTLEQLVLQFGKPDIVLWTDTPNGRFLVWANKGISVITEASPKWLYGVKQDDWSDKKVYRILIFEPMDLDQFMQIEFPFQGWFPGYFVNDPYKGSPEYNPSRHRDPFDWEHMPTPSIVEQP